MTRNRAGAIVLLLAAGACSPKQPAATVTVATRAPRVSVAVRDDGGPPLP